MKTMRIEKERLRQLEVKAVDISVKLKRPIKWQDVARKAMDKGFKKVDEMDFDREFDE